MHSVNKKKQQNRTFLEVVVKGYALISDPLLNKGMAFTEEERSAFNLFGLLPYQEETLDFQCKRCYKIFIDKVSDLEKYIYLRALQDTNEVLFYALLHRHLTEMMPIIYTPTVGLGCQAFSRSYRRSRGLFIAYPDRHRIEQMLSNPRFDHVKVVVVSDGERILGLGDQGAGGMGISIGKLSLYTACAGIFPGDTLPILLDVGTNNKVFLKDPLYIGWRHRRIEQAAYREFIEMFVQAIKKRFPFILLQWEDLAGQNASYILERYADQLCTFNDDIQGTAAVAAGTLLSAIQMTDIPLRDQRFVVVGAGSAGCGISGLLLLLLKTAGLSEAEARSRFFMLNSKGLLIEGMPHLLDFQRPFAQPSSWLDKRGVQDVSQLSLLDVIKQVRPTALVGVSGQRGIFTEQVVKAMAASVKYPVIFPLSNPTHLSEATPADLMRWTGGRVILGTGSPFDSVERNGKPFRVDQVNNAYIFPGIGLGLLAVKAQQAPEALFLAAAKALAACSPGKGDHRENLLLPLTQIRDVSFKIALAVAKKAVELNVATVPVDSEQTLERLIQCQIWNPVYLPYKVV